MYCSKCNHSIEDDSKFCPFCGTQCVEFITQTVEESSPGSARTAITYESAPCEKTSDPAEATERKANYYEVQFAAIARGEKPKFNWIAFLFGPANQLYHQSSALFRRTFLPPMVALAIWSVISLFTNLVVLVIFNDVTIVALFIVQGAGMLLYLWVLATALKNGRTYTRFLYDQTGGEAARIAADRKIVSRFFAVIGCYLLLLVILLPALLGKLIPAAFGAEEYDAESSYATSPVQPQESESISLWISAPDENWWEGPWESLDTGKISVFPDDFMFVQEGSETDTGYYADVVGLDGEKCGAISISADGTTLTETVIDSPTTSYDNLYRRPTQIPTDALPEAFWGIYTTEAADGSTVFIVVDAFQYGAQAYANARVTSQNTVVFECGNNYPFWVQLNLQADGILNVSTSEDGSTYYSGYILTPYTAN